MKKVDLGIALQAALRWSWSLQLQIRRLHGFETAALAAQHEVEKTHVHLREHNQPFLELYTEVHMVLVAAHNLATALELLGLSSIAEPDLELVRLLRNIQEHWDDVGGKSIDAFVVNYGGDPIRYTWGAGGSSLGGLPLDDVGAWGARVYDQLTDPKNVGA